MNKYEVFEEIREQLVNATTLTRQTDEGALLLAVVLQAIKDAMGLYSSDKELIYKPHRRGVRGKRRFTTEQQEAIDWFKGKEHYRWCDMVEVDPSWVTHLIKTKGGIQL